jgi:hypothetical protein
MRNPNDLRILEGGELLNNFLDELAQDGSQPKAWKPPVGERRPSLPQQFQAFGAELSKARNNPQRHWVPVSKELAEELFQIVHELGWGYNPVFRETGGLWVCTTCKGTTPGPDHGWKDIAHGARCPHQHAMALTKYWEAGDGEG